MQLGIFPHHQVRHNINLCVSGYPTLSNILPRALNFVSIFRGFPMVFPSSLCKNIKKNVKAISHTHRNRTEKIKCIKLYGRFHICAETERRTENVHEFDFIFLVSVAEFQQIRQVILIKSAHTQPRALYLIK